MIECLTIKEDVMEQTTEEYSTRQLFSMIQSAETASLSTEKGKAMFSRFMKFACNRDVSAFYFLTRKYDDRINEIRESSACTVMLTSIGRSGEENAEITVKGRLTALTDIKAAETRAGFRELIERSGFAQMLYESGSMRDYMMLKVVPEHISVRRHDDPMENVFREKEAAIQE